VRFNVNSLTRTPPKRETMHQTMYHCFPSGASCLTTGREQVAGSACKWPLEWSKESSGGGWLSSTTLRKISALALQIHSRARTKWNSPNTMVFKSTNLRRFFQSSPSCGLVSWELQSIRRYKVKLRRRFPQMERRHKPAPKWRPDTLLMCKQIGDAFH